MPYPSDITEEQYLLVSDIFNVGLWGNRRKHSVLSLINAVFYLIAELIISCTGSILCRYDYFVLLCRSLYTPSQNNLGSSSSHLYRKL
jgi:hypothetical protein